MLFPYIGKKLNQSDKFKHLICIASGKGGVGKSTTAVNLALALAANKQVGLLDADIYGPSIPLMMGVEPGTRPEIQQQKYIVPIQAHGIECNSMGFLVDQNTAMVWRAPMIISAFNQILNEEAIFGSGGGDRLAAEYGVEVIGRLPLDLDIREKTDAGNPVVASTPDEPPAQAYFQLAKNVERKIEEFGESAQSGPTITVSED